MTHVTIVQADYRLSGARTFCCYWGPSITM